MHILGACSHFASGGRTPTCAPSTVPWCTFAGSRTARRAPPDPGRRSSGAASALAREPVLALHGRLRPHDRTRGHRCRPGAQGTSAYASPRLRIRAGQQGPRHPGHPRVAWSSIDYQHCGLHGFGAGWLHHLQNRAPQLISAAIMRTNPCRARTFVHAYPPWVFSGPNSVVAAGSRSFSCEVLRNTSQRHAGQRTLLQHPRGSPRRREPSRHPCRR